MALGAAAANFTHLTPLARAQHWAQQASYMAVQTTDFDTPPAAS